MHQDPQRGEIIRLIQQLKRGQQLKQAPQVSCVQDWSVKDGHRPDALDIRVLPQTLAALAARRHT
ncbi:MAG: hypothetical protein AAFU71_01850 [Cyanobacteria bacterium J06632_22]